MTFRIGAIVLLLVIALIDGWLALSGHSAGFDRAGLLLMAGGPIPLWRVITHLGDPPVRLALAVAGVAVLLFGRRPRPAALLALAYAGGLILSGTAKDWAVRPRPMLLPHRDVVTSWSFPSGHALNGTIVWLGLALLVVPIVWRRPAIGAALAIAGAIGFSRMALAVHWPTDVIAGWAIGGAWMLAVAAFADADPSARSAVHDPTEEPT